MKLRQSFASVEIRRCIQNVIDNSPEQFDGYVKPFDGALDKANLLVRGTLGGGLVVIATWDEKPRWGGVVKSKRYYRKPGYSVQSLRNVSADIKHYLYYMRDTLKEVGDLHDDIEKLDTIDQVKLEDMVMKNDVTIVYDEMTTGDAKKIRCMLEQNILCKCSARRVDLVNN
jgi:hypothetical protein